MARRRVLNRERLPGTLDEARRLIAYNEDVIRTSRSVQRRDRAAQMLSNLRPELARLEAADARREGPRAPATRIINGEEFEITFDGS
jgi:hypothetical protein